MTNAGYTSELLAEDLVARIERGDLGPGDRIPTTADLAAQYEVNKNTASKALSALKAAGVLTGSAGGHTRVRVRPPQVIRHNLRYHREKSNALLEAKDRRQYGVAEADSGLAIHQLHSDIYEYELVRGPDDVRKILGVDGNKKILRRTSTRRHAPNAGASYSVSYLPHDLVRSNSDLLDASKEPWPGGTLHQLHTVGVEVDVIEDRVISCIPTPDEQRLLDIPPGVPILHVRKTSFSTSGEAVEVADIPLPADRTELVFTTRLERW